MHSSHGWEGIRWIGPAAGGLRVAVGTSALTPSAAWAQGAVASEASAANEESGLGEIVVTARKRVETMQSIPESIAAFGSQEIADAHITKIDDLANLVSNLNITTRADNTPDVVLRGVGSFGVVSGVGFYANEVQLFDGKTVRADDIERIEVLKGPQGTLYGGSNIGGAIKYVTKDPTSTWQNEATVELGQYKTRNVSAVLSGPITDKLGVRASVYDDNHDGYIYDTYHNQTFGKGHDHGARLTFVYEPQ